MAQEEFYYDLLNLNEEVEVNAHFQNANNLIAIQDLNKQMEEENIMRNFNNNIDFSIENENVMYNQQDMSRNSSNRSSISDGDFHPNEYHSLNDYQEDEIELPTENFLNQPLFEKSQHTV